MEQREENVLGQERENKGIFVENLKRTNSKIKADRASAIAEDAELKFKRKIEDLTIERRGIQRKREAMLDMSPNNTMTIISVDTFDADAFVETDLALGVEIRELDIKIEVLTDRYETLFGKYHG